MENQPPRPRLRPHSRSEPDHGLVIVREIVQEIGRLQRKGIYSLGVIKITSQASDAIAQSRDAKALLSEWGYEHVNRV